MSGNKKLFGELGKAVGEQKEIGVRKRSKNLLEQRVDSLSDIARGALETKQLRRVDPAVCKMWAGHNRRYDLLNENRCKDLIDGFKAQGRQEFPAIVRKLDKDSEFEYEVICGARRHWTVSWLRENNYPDFDYLIEVRDLTDEQAFRLSDVENRDKEDISDFERARDYANALSAYYKTQKEMAARLEVSEAWLSRYLDLSKIPDTITKAFASVTEINVKNGRELKPLLADARKTAKMESRALELEEEQTKSRSEGKAGLGAAQVVRELKQAAQGARKAARPKAEIVKADDGRVIARIEQGGRGVVKADLHVKNASTKDLLALLKRAIDDAKTQ